jgi:uncharacterized protein YcaQ
MSSTITPEQARWFQLNGLGLSRPFPNVAAALAHLGFIQMDPINICGRMHDLILRNRVTGYREGELLRYTYSARTATERRAFEHYLPGQGILVTFPMEAWPWLAPHMKSRARRESGYARKLSAAEERIAALILRELAERGPLTSDDIEHDGRAHSGWGTPSRAVKVVLEKLFVHGRVLIADRRQFRRVYDLPERVLPEHCRRAPVPSSPDQQRWLIHQRLRQRRLVTLRKADVPVVEDFVHRVEVPGCPLLFCLREDRELLEQAAGESFVGGEPRLLAPLDPLIYDRKLTSKLWGFDYTWEVYTPSGKRTRGYYALPLLSGSELVGHVDPKADRKAKRLRVVGRKVRRGHQASLAVKALAKFLGLRT